MFVRMQVRPRTRFCIGITVAGTASFLSVLAFAWKDWIEILIGVDPDTSSRALEWLIPFLLSGAAAGDLGRGLSPSGGR
jgi:hypothetical protein